MIFFSHFQRRIFLQFLLYPFFQVGSRDLQQFHQAESAGEIISEVISAVMIDLMPSLRGYCRMDEFSKNPPIPQKSRRKFTFNYEESTGTSNLFSCCLVDNVFLPDRVGTKSLWEGVKKGFFTGPLSRFTPWAVIPECAGLCGRNGLLPLALQMKIRESIVL